MVLKQQKLATHIASSKQPKRKLVSKSLFWLVLALSTYSHSNEPDIFDIIVTPYPPFVDEAAENGGMSIALLNQLLSQFNYSFKVIYVPPVRAQKLIESEAYLITILPPSRDRSGFLRFEVNSTTFNYTLFQLASSNAEWNKLSDKNIGSLDFRYGQPFLKLLEEEGGKIITVPNFESGLKMLNAGRIDFLIGMDQTILETAQELNMLNEIVANEDSIHSFGALAFYVNMTHPLASQLVDYLEKQTLLEINKVKLSLE